MVFDQEEAAKDGIPNATPQSHRGAFESRCKPHEEVHLPKHQHLENAGHTSHGRRTKPQRKYAPFWAGLILGVIWATWHIPSFLMSGTPQSAWSFGPFFLGVVAISVILTPFFNASQGSLLVAILYHFQMMNPIWPDAQPWDNLLFIIAAVIIVWLNWHEMFKKGAGVTDVLMPQGK